MRYITSGLFVGVACFLGLSWLPSLSQTRSVLISEAEATLLAKQALQRFEVKEAKVSKKAVLIAHGAGIWSMEFQDASGRRFEVTVPMNHKFVQQIANLQWRLYEKQKIKKTGYVINSHTEAKNLVEKFRKKFPQYKSLRLESISFKKDSSKSGRFEYASIEAKFVSPKKIVSRTPRAVYMLFDPHDACLLGFSDTLSSALQK